MKLLETLLTIDQVAAAVGKRPKTVRNMCWRRQIEYLKINRNIRFRPSVIAELLEQCVVPVRKT
jgi:hypothetical protein